MLRRLAIGGLLLVLVSTVTFFANRPACLAYAAAVFASIGLHDLAADAYRSGVERYPADSPDWAFLELTKLRPDPVPTVQVADIAFRGGHSSLAERLYRSAVLASGKAVRPTWLSQWASLITEVDTHHVRELYAASEVSAAEPVDLVEMARIVASRGHNEIAADFYGLAVLRAGKVVRPTWLRQWASLITEADAHHVRELYAASETSAAEPDDLIEIARIIASRGHKKIAADFYGLAVLRAGKATSPVWLSEWAFVTVTSNSNRAAELYLAAAKLTLDRNPAPSDEAIAYLGSSLALRQNDEARWTLLQLYLSKDRVAAEGLLRSMTATGRNAYRANHLLGVLLWDAGKVNEADAYLRKAAEEERFQSTYNDYKSWKTAQRKLQELEADNAQQLKMLSQGEEKITSESATLYTRLAKFSCDVRQFPIWERLSDRQLEDMCSQKSLEAVFNQIAMLAFLVAPVGRIGAVGRIGTAAEFGAAARMARTGELHALTRGASRGAAEEGALARRPISKYNTAFHAAFRDALAEERAAVMSEIELAFRTERQTVIQTTAPSMARETSIIKEAVANRAVTIINVQKTMYSFGLTLKLPGLF